MTLEQIYADTDSWVKEMELEAFQDDEEYDDE